MSFKIRITKFDETKLESPIHIVPFISDENATATFQNLIKIPKETWEKVSMYKTSKGKIKLFDSWKRKKEKPSKGAPK